MKIELPKEDYEFLKELQHELNTQETDYQDDPIYWSVMEKREVLTLTDEDHISNFSGAFITKRACQKHIEANKHHYCQPHTYANTAYRNYELERLLKILKTMKMEE